MTVWWHTKYDENELIAAIKKIRDVTEDEALKRYCESILREEEPHPFSLRLFHVVSKQKEVLAIAQDFLKEDQDASMYEIRTSCWADELDEGFTDEDLRNHVIKGIEESLAEELAEARAARFTIIAKAAAVGMTKELGEVAQAESNDILMLFEKRLEMLETKLASSHYDASEDEKEAIRCETDFWKEVSTQAIKTILHPDDWDVTVEKDYYFPEPYYYRETRYGRSERIDNSRDTSRHPPNNVTLKKLNYYAAIGMIELYGENAIQECRDFGNKAAAEADESYYMSQDFPEESPLTAYYKTIIDFWFNLEDIAIPVVQNASIFEISFEEDQDELIQYN